VLALEAASASIEIMRFPASALSYFVLMDLPKLKTNYIRSLNSDCLYGLEYVWIVSKLNHA
jgi:hypothetical protein